MKKLCKILHLLAMMTGYIVLSTVALIATFVFYLVITNQHLIGP